MNLWKDVIVTEDLVNLKEDGVSAEVAIDVKKGRKKKDTLKQWIFKSNITFRKQQQWRLRMNSAVAIGWALLHCHRWDLTCGWDH